MNLETPPDRAVATTTTAWTTTTCDGSHNTAVDDGRRADGACAQVHLPTGRMCTLRHRHDASCEFVPADQIDASLALHRATEGW